VHETVKVHPHRTMVNSGVEACVSVTPDVPGGHAYYKGTVALYGVSFRVYDSGVARAQREQVRNVHAWAVGELAFQSDYQHDRPFGGISPEWAQITYHYNIGRFIAVEDGTDVTDGHFRQAWFKGRDFYVSKDW